VNAPPPAVFLTTTEAAARLGVSDKTLRRWSNDGLLRLFITPGGHRRYRVEDLDRFLADRTEEATEASAS